MPIVRKLQADAMDQAVPVTHLLRMAKVIATKLNLKDALVWIDRELNGYMGLGKEDLPVYRRLAGQPEAYNPYYGWQPILFKHSETAEAYSYAPTGQTLGSIEQMLADERAKEFFLPYPVDIQNMLRESIGIQTDVHVAISRGSLVEIVEAVRHLILNWSLELETAGILGEEMTFTPEEQKHATSTTQSFFI